MTLWVATDIFGDQPQLRHQLDQLGCAYQVVQPYAGEMPAFSNDEQAYQAFVASGAMPAYINKLQQLLAAADTEVTLLGFSAGASAAWVCAASLCTQQNQPAISQLFGVYGGQIRDYTDLQPRCPVTLLFCQQERHFSMPDLLIQLQYKQRVSLQTVPQPHGFINPLSQNYNPVAAQEFWSLCRSWLNENLTQALPG